MDIIQAILSFILVVITGVYAILTRKMVKEMRAAREAQSEAELIATLEPIGPLYAKLRILNAGSGVAFQVEVKFRLEPDSGENPVWRQPAMTSGYFRDFLLPDKTSDRLPPLKETAAKYDKLIVELTWFNVFNRQHSRHCEIDLKLLAEGWYESHNLVGPEEFPQQIDKIHDELRDIKEAFKDLNRANLKRNVDHSPTLPRPS